MSILSKIRDRVAKARAAQQQAVAPAQTNWWEDPNVFAAQNPAPQAPSNSWGYVPPSSFSSEGSDGGGSASVARYNDPRRAELYDRLKGRADQSLTIDWRKDPVIRAQSDAFAANQERARRTSVNRASEAAGPYGNIDTERRMAAESAAQATAGFEGQLMQHELNARRGEIAGAIEGMGGILSEDMGDDRERALGELSANTARSGYATQRRGQDLQWQQALMGHDEFNRNLGLNEWDRANYWDALRSGLM